MALLRLENVTKRFGGLVAVDKVNLEIQPGELIGIVGPNGSGKTTLFNVISGVYPPEEGKVTFDGKDITQFPPYKRAPLGLGRTFQIPRPFSSASVRENVAIGAMFGTLAGHVNVDDSLEIADRYIKLVTPVEKKMVEIARALAMKPKLLLMDEAMAGMNPKDIDNMVQFIKRIKEEEEIAIVSMVEHIMRAVVSMVEHIMRAVVGLAERVMVMNFGAKLVDAKTEEALTDPRVIEVYLGHPPDEKKWKSEVWKEGKDSDG
ncbi:MAG: ABC transporter ATP-binding protein [Deltaproteobacteria bacterium]|nr:ABC transporter ATP-binding protein [Deltaproteobacteria bacterium]